MKKGNFPVSYYAKQFLEKLSLVKHLAPDENSKIKAYLTGLPVDMRTEVRISKVATLHEAIEESLRMEYDITKAREERYQAGEKRKGEESTEPTRTAKTNQEGIWGESRNETRWCGKCRSKHNGSCHRAPQLKLVSCGKCGKRGHVAQDCSLKGRFATNARNRDTSEENVRN